MGDLARSLDSGLTRESECRACEAVVVWAVMETSGKRNPLNRRPDPDGRLVIVAWQATERGMAPVVRHLHGDEVLAHDGARYESHFASCPKHPRS